MLWPLALFGRQTAISQNCFFNGKHSRSGQYLLVKQPHHVEAVVGKLGARQVVLNQLRVGGIHIHRNRPDLLIDPEFFQAIEERLQIDLSFSFDDMDDGPIVKIHTTVAYLCPL